MRLAKEEGFKPYYVFNNKTLTDLVRFKPTTFDAIVGIHGIGQRKVDWFGKEVLDIINQ